MVQYSNTQFSSQLESRPLGNLGKRKCLTLMPLVFPLFYYGGHRMLVTTSITPSLVAKGEPNIHQ